MQPFVVSTVGALGARRDMIGFCVSLLGFVMDGFRATLMLYRVVVEGMDVPCKKLPAWALGFIIVVSISFSIIPI